MLEFGHLVLGLHVPSHYNRKLPTKGAESYQLNLNKFLPDRFQMGRISAAERFLNVYFSVDCLQENERRTVNVVSIVIAWLVFIGEPCNS